MPVIATFLDIDSLRQALVASGTQVGISFAFPAMIVDLWTFVSLPAQGSGIYISPTVIALPIIILIQSALAAGYLGSIHEDARTGQYQFRRNVQRYFVPFLKYTALLWLGFVVIIVVGVALPLLVLLFIPVFLVLSYLFYTTPYLLVVADMRVIDALRESYEFAVAGGAYFAYGVRYFVFVAALSIIGTGIAANFGILGVILGTVLAAPVAVTLNAATMQFVESIT